MDKEDFVLSDYIHGPNGSFGVRIRDLGSNLVYIGLCTSIHPQKVI